MSNDKNNEFHGEILTPEIARKQIIEIGKVNRIPPEVGIFDSPTRCFVVNVEWWAHIAGMVHWLADVTAWQDAEDESYFAIREILRFMQGMECMDFQLRQNPDDSCILQQSLDGGATWSDVFDFALCQVVNPAINQTAIYNTYINQLTTFQNNIYNNYVENYTTSITNIHPELGYGDADDSNRDLGLCNALRKLVDSICDSALEILAESDNVANDLKSSLALVGAVLGLFILAGTGIGLPAAAIGAASLAAAGIGLGAAVAAAIYDKVSEMTEATLENHEARQELACCLYDEMQGSNADKAALEAAFSACTGLSADANDIRELGAIMVQEMAFYAAFAEKLAIDFQSAKLGLMPECPCGAGEWSYNQDFTTGLGDWQIRQPAGFDPQGTLTGAGIESVLSPFNDEEVQVFLEVDSAIVWTTLSFRYTRSGADGGGNDDERVFVATNTNTGSGQSAVYTDGAITTNGEIIVCLDPLVSPLSRKQIVILLRGNNPGDSLVLKEARVWGTGTIPSPLMDNSEPECIS